MYIPILSDVSKGLDAIKIIVVGVAVITVTLTIKGLLD